MNRFYMLIASMLFIHLNSFSKAPIKFGKVSMEEMEMTTYEPDTSASAVILCKYGYFNANEFQFTLTQRVKILKKSGVDHASFIFPGDEKSDIRAKVYNLENGEIVEEKVSKESIFKERVTDDYYRIRVALPNVKVGTVYEVEVYRSLLPPEFTFQEDIPIKHAEVRLEETKYISWRKRSVGELVYQKLDDYTFAADNVPAFKSEPFINSANNYTSKFEFDILNINIPGYFYKNYSTDWGAVNDRLAESDYFAGVLTNGAGYLSDIIDDIEAKYTDPYDQMKAAYEAIKKVKWNGSEQLFTNTTSLSSAFKEGEANSAEINLMLLQLLKKMNIYSLPVALSTRENGLLNKYYPSLDKLNYVIVWAKIDDKEYLLDATAELLPVGLLPSRCLNQYARLITNEKGKWIDLNSPKGENETMFYSLKLNDDLSMDGNIQYSRKDYSAYNFRKKYKDYTGQDEFLQHLETKYPGLRIVSGQIENIEAIDLPIKDKYDVKIKNMAQQTGDLVMINPFMFEKMDENPFKLEERHYPIDFAYSKDKMMVTKINIPSSYSINELPKPVHIKLPDNSASVLINYQTIGNNITVTYKFSIDKPMFQASEYGMLKQLYGVIIEKQAEPIILKKNETAAL